MKKPIKLNLFRLMEGYVGNVQSVKGQMTRKINMLLNEIGSLKGRPLSTTKKELIQLQIKRRLLNGFPPEAKRPVRQRKKPDSNS